MRPMTATLLCVLVAGCATPQRPDLARGADARRPELAIAAAQSSDNGCVVQTTSGGPVTDRNGNPVRCGTPGPARSGS